MKKLLGIGLGIMVLGIALMGCGSKDDVETIVDDGFVETIEVEEIEVEEIEIEEIEVEQLEVEEEPYVSDEYLEELEYNSQVNRY